jgi:ParB-like nuclease domain
LEETEVWKGEEVEEINKTERHPVSNVLWVDSDFVFANDYNPNKVAPPEMELLKLSIESDGYTQPIVTWKVEENKYEVIDGFHRHLVGKALGLKKLPIVIVNKDRLEKNDRIASTIRHNRARGKHVVQAMSDIVIELKNRNWKNERIARELGMEEDEVLRLLQITGLASLFKDDDFSKSWDIKDSSPEEEFVPLEDLVSEEEKEKYGFRTVNTSDDKRVFHTFDKWECYKAGFYANSHPELTKEECEEEYRKFLSDEEKFKKALNGVITEWKHSCEHYLTNASMNRIAWLGQASLCYATGIPSTFRAGFHLLTEDQQEKANNIALIYLNKWLKKHNMVEVSIKEATTDRQATIY